MYYGRLARFALALKASLVCGIYQGMNASKWQIAKITTFVTSCICLDETMTAGTECLVWMAREVMIG
ncbi:hypothetical protein PHMEG_0009223 [Phytophthora megakarya]|uniref:Secreted protein n=1 Tax=Phytophthora megakarya TaxID=4795 RepID=A0A225WJ66_9STRA|nr:hypothetical protein PHMEG_0009223 [Phytophthora megakarya]